MTFSVLLFVKYLYFTLCPAQYQVPYHPISLLQKKLLFILYFLQEERKPRGKEKEDVDLLFRMEGLMSATGRINLQSESNMEN